VLEALDDAYDRTRAGRTLAGVGRAGAEKLA
jgi:hypothetical protein